jgi:hypothetical protein
MSFRRLFLFLLVFIFSLQRFSFGENVPAVMHAIPQDGYEVKEDKIYYRYGNCGIILEIGTDRAVANYYLDRGIQLGNPFRNTGGEYEGATIFIVTFLNRSAGSIAFTPSYVTMKIKSTAVFPMDFTVLVGLMGGQEPRIQKVLENSIFHSPETIRKGEVVTKLLVYPALPKKSLDLRLEFEYLYFENHETKPIFYFSRKKE